MAVTTVKAPPFRHGAAGGSLVNSAGWEQQCVSHNPSIVRVAATALILLDLLLLAAGWFFGLTGAGANLTLRAVEPASPHMLVVAIDPKGPAGQAGLQVGDVLTGVSGRAPLSEGEWHALFTGRPGDTFRVTVEPSNAASTAATQDVTVTLPANLRNHATLVSLIAYSIVGLAFLCMAGLVAGFRPGQEGALHLLAAGSSAGFMLGMY